MFFFIKYQEKKRNLLPMGEIFETLEKTNEIFGRVLSLDNELAPKRKAIIAMTANQLSIKELIINGVGLEFFCSFKYSLIVFKNNLKKNNKKFLNLFSESVSFKNLILA
jgi:hypothetical protein